MPGRIFGENTVRSLLTSAGANPDAIDQLIENAGALEAGAHPTGTAGEVGNYVEAAYGALDRAGAHVEGLAEALQQDTPVSDAEAADVFVRHAGGFFLELGRALTYTLADVAQGVANR